MYYISKLFKKLRLKAVKNSILSNSSKIHSGSLFVNSSISRYSYCGYDCNFINTDIGSFCSIASNVTCGSASHPIHFVSTSPCFLSHKSCIKKKFSKFDYLPVIRTTIDSDVWIGDGVFIKAGVEVGVGAVIGMGSVVTKDVPPYSIVAGNPASIIRKRFSEEMIEKLLQSKWWDLPEDKLEKLAFYFDKPDDFLKNLSRL